MPKPRSRSAPDLQAVGESPEREGVERALATLPSVDSVTKLLDTPEGRRWSRAARVEAIRSSIGELRDSLRRGETIAAKSLCEEGVAAAVLARLQRDAAPSLRRVVNATGVVLHTNLGRACLSEAAVQAVTMAARHPVNLEYDLEQGRRGERDAHVEGLLCELCGSEAATVVNNNAAALLLVLGSLAAGREVIVSRGELVEIGGSFRLPELMAASGARLREVGTTNRTHPADYRQAIGPDTALLLKVHTSNYDIVGFTAEVDLGDLAKLREETPGLAVVEDLGSGAVIDFARLGLGAEPRIAESIRAGADLVLASADKLLGGPQCGIIVGRRHLVETLRRHPLKRALRCDKMTLAALEATLREYRYAPAPESSIPTLRRLLRPLDELRLLGEQALALLRARRGGRWSFEIVPSRAAAGSGSQPNVTIPSLAIAVRSPDLAASAIERMFRAAVPPVLGRIEDGLFLLDLRTIDDPADLVPATL